MTARAIIHVPATARKGEIIEIRTLVGHPMETGFRRNHLGEALPRDIVSRFVCTYNGAEILSADLHPAIAANPLLVFHTVATESGTIECRWSGDNGLALTAGASITVI